MEPHLTTTPLLRPYSFKPNVKNIDSFYYFEDPVNATTSLLRPGFYGPTVVVLTGFHCIEKHPGFFIEIRNWDEGLLKNNDRQDVAQPSKRRHRKKKGGGGGNSGWNLIFSLYNFGIKSPFARDNARVNKFYTAISRKVEGKSARDNPERYRGWFWVHCSSEKFERSA